MEFQWTTKEGKKILVKDMTDSHLGNAINFLKRKIKAYPGWQSYVGNSIHAEEAVDQENMANEEGLDNCQAMLEIMEKEQNEREAKRFTALIHDKNRG